MSRPQSDALNVSVRTVPALPLQHFAGSSLDRSLPGLKRFDGAAVQGAQEVCLVVCSGREICVHPQDSDGTGPTQDLQILLLGSNDPQLDLNNEDIALLFSEDGEGAETYRLPLYLLGQDVAERWTFALDISGPCKQAFVQFLQETCGLGVVMQDLRALMPSLSRDACAIAGHAASLSQWHQTHRFCHRCGAPTVAIEAGLRRKCVEAEHKLYPRTDPVVIMLVESPDGQRALLGRSRKFTPGMYTCLSGFIDQCESIEEAVRREVREEARVAVQDVQIVGSQPWPVGRYGSCELMLGCIAKARSYEIMVNTGEMEDVQWYDREELRAAITLYDDMGDTSVGELQQHSMDTLGFFVPPPLAIAHHLMRLWATHSGPWFPPLPPHPAGGRTRSHREGEGSEGERGSGATSHGHGRDGTPPASNL